MRIMKLFGGKALAVALACAMVPASAAIPSSTPIVGAVVGTSEANAQYYRGDRGHYRGGGRHFRGDRGYHRGGGRHYRGGRYYNRRGNNGGAAVAGAIAGLAAGAIIAGAASQPRYVERRYVPAQTYRGGLEPWSREWYRYCSNRYRSFDPNSGTFQPYNGPRQLCR